LSKAAFRFTKNLFSENGYTSSLKKKGGDIVEEGFFFFFEFN
jgi:hypothetical protein